MPFFRQRPIATRAEYIVHIATVWLAVVCGGFAIWLILAAYRLAPQGGQLMGLTLLAIITANFALTIVRIHLRGRGTRIIQQHQFYICPGCRFDLKGLSDSGRCPECGRAHSKDDLNRTWANAYRMPSSTRAE